MRKTNYSKYFISLIIVILITLISCTKTKKYVEDDFSISCPAYMNMKKINGTKALGTDSNIIFYTLYDKRHKKLNDDFSEDISIIIRENKNDETIKHLIKENYGNGVKSIQKKELKLNGENCLKITLEHKVNGLNNSFIQYFFIKNQKISMFSFGCKTENMLKYQDVANKVLSSIQIK